jgi:hypothetical protein
MAFANMDLTVPRLNCAAIRHPAGSCWQHRPNAAKPRYPMISETELYTLRCNVTHRAKAVPKQAQGHGLAFDPVAFVVPHASAESSSSWHLKTSDVDGKRALAVDASYFCHDVINSVNQ